MQKKIVYILIALAILFGSAGCSGRDLPRVAESTAEPLQPAAYEAPLPPATPLVPAPAFTPASTPEDPLAPADGAYTFAWLSDTQHYSEKFGDTFLAMTRFLSEQQDRLKLEYVIFTGDFVQNKGKEKEWQLARTAWDSIDDIPNGVLAGNHDVRHSSADYSEFSKYFGADRWADKPWYGGSFEDNRCHFDLISAGATDYIFVYVGYPVSPETAEYARRTFLDHPDRIGVLCTHDYFRTDVTLSESGKTFFDEVVRPCPNVYIVLCGHRYNQACVSLPMDDDGDGEMDRMVYQMMMNYQAAGQFGGDGFMRLIRIDESSGTLNAISYSPMTDDFNYFDTAESQTIKYPANPLFESYTRTLPWLVYS